MKILMLSHTADFGAFKVGSHHLAREFACAGHSVVHLSTPLSWPQLVSGKAAANRVELARSGPVRDENGVTHVVGVVPVPLRLAAQRRRVAELISNADADDADIVFLDEPLMAPVVRPSHRATVVYRPTDVYDTGVRAARQARVLERVDAVVATSRVVLDDLNPPAALPAVVVENGVEFERFSAVTEQERHGVVYVGALDERFDWNAVAHMAQAVPEAQIDIFGPTSERTGLPRNVRLRGPIPYRDVPSVLASARVGILPFTHSRLNSGRSPMKFYEYLAAGLNVVASTTPVLESRRAPGALLYSHPRDAPTALRAALALPSPNLAGREDARVHAWAAKAEEVLGFAATLRHRGAGETTCDSQR